MDKFILYEGNLHHYTGAVHFLCRREGWSWHRSEIIGTKLDDLALPIPRFL